MEKKGKGKDLKTKDVLTGKNTAKPAAGTNIASRNTWTIMIWNRTGNFVTLRDMAQNLLKNLPYCLGAYIDYNPNTKQPKDSHYSKMVFIVGAGWNKDDLVKVLNCDCFTLINFPSMAELEAYKVNNRDFFSQRLIRALQFIVQKR